MGYGIRGSGPKWFGLLSGAMYIPVELIAITRGATWPKVTSISLSTQVLWAIWLTPYGGHAMIKNLSEISCELWLEESSLRGRDEMTIDKLLLVDKGLYRKNRVIMGAPGLPMIFGIKDSVCGKNRVARIMKANGIVAKTKKKFKATTNSKHQSAGSGEPVEQDFTSPKPNESGVSDVNVHLDK